MESVPFWAGCTLAASGHDTSLADPASNRPQLLVSYIGKNQWREGGRKGGKHYLYYIMSDYTSLLNMTNMGTTRPVTLAAP